MNECPIKTPVRVIETNGSIVDAENEMVLKVLYDIRKFDLQIQQLHYAAKVINNHEKLLKLLKDAQRYIRAKDPKYIEIEQVLKKAEKPK